MRTERIYFYEDREDVYLDVTLCDVSSSLSVSSRPAILILPGGGYGATSDRESDPVARKYIAEGFNTAVLRYTTQNSGYPLYDEKVGIPFPLIEASKAMSILRDRAEEWSIIPDKIAVIGFSAGGHLCASLGTLWHKKELEEYLDIKHGYNKPNAMLPIYPVISGVSHPHKGSFDNLLGADASEEKIKEYSLEFCVDENTVPAFIYHTFEDPCVPVFNSIEFAHALAEHNIPFELHIMPDGTHGLSTCTREVMAEPHKYNARWVEWSVKWLEKIFDLK